MEFDEELTLKKRKTFKASLKNLIKCFKISGLSVKKEAMKNKKAADSDVIRIWNTFKFQP